MSDNTFQINYAKSFSRNVITNIISLAISTLVGLLLVPFFLDSLGPSAYALIPLATSLAGYVTFIIDILNASVSRYLTIELQTGNIQKANETYSTSYAILLITVLICIPIALAVSFAAPWIFETGSITDTEVMLFFIMILGSILVSTLKSNFMVVLFAYNRLDLRNIVTITQTLVQVGLIVILIWILKPSLYCVGFAYITAAAVSLLIAHILAKRQNTSLHFSLSSFNKSRLKELGSLSFLYCFDRFGCILQSQIALIVVNVYFGAVMQAEYSLVLSWGGVLISLGGVISATASPKVYSLAGLHDDKAIIDFVSIFTKFIGLLIALPIALLCIFAPQLMTIWVGAEYASLTPLVWILIPAYYFSITLSGQVPIAISHLRMQFPAVINIVFGLLYLGMALVIPKVFDTGYYGVALAWVIMIILHHGLISPVFYSIVAKGKPFAFVKKSAVGLLAMLILMAVGVLYTSLVSVDSFFMLILSGGVISAIYLFLVVKVILSKEEKDLAKSCLPGFVQNMKIVKWM